MLSSKPSATPARKMQRDAVRSDMSGSNDLERRGVGRHEQVSVFAIAAGEPFQGSADDVERFVVGALLGVAENSVLGNIRFDFAPDVVHAEAKIRNAALAKCDVRHFDASNLVNFGCGAITADPQLSLAADCSDQDRLDEVVVGQSVDDQASALRIEFLLEFGHSYALLGARRVGYGWENQMRRNTHRETSSRTITAANAVSTTSHFGIEVGSGFAIYGTGGCDEARLVDAMHAAPLAAEGRLGGFVRGFAEDVRAKVTMSYQSVAGPLDALPSGRRNGIPRNPLGDSGLGNSDLITESLLAGVGDPEIVSDVHRSIVAPLLFQSNSPAHCSLYT